MSRGLIVVVAVIYVGVAVGYLRERRPGMALAFFAYALANVGFVLDWGEMMLSTDAKKRKEAPIFSGVLNYFPDAIVAVAELSRIGNEQHNPGSPLHWDRSKSGDEKDALSRHLLEAGTIDTDGVRHSTKVAWRALANLQKELENAAAVAGFKDWEVR